MLEAHDQLGRSDGRIPTSLVGSYAQPSWLIDRERLRGKLEALVEGAHLAFQLA